MNEKQIIEIIKKYLLSVQYQVTGVPWHIHDGTSSPLIPVRPSSLLLNYASTISIGRLFSLYTTTTSGGDSTIKITAIAQAGQRITILITNDATANRTITFGTGFNSSGTLTGTTSKTASISFISDGVTYWETSRATGL